MAAEAARDAFIHALANGMWLSAGVAAAGALLALWLIGGKPAHASGPAVRPDAAAATAEAL